MLLKVRYYGDPILRKKAALIPEITAEIRKLVEDMIETMDATNGIGLAAPQVGHSIRLFTLRDYIELENGQLSVSEPKVYINPRLYSPSEETWLDMEGCLSLPGFRIEVERPVSICVEATDINGKIFIENLQGLNARVRMHENDHLNGVLHIDRANAKEKRRIEKHLLQIKKKYPQPS